MAELMMSSAMEEALLAYVDAVADHLDPARAGPSGAETRSRCRCGRPAQVCDECRRAVALKSFMAISRHPESGLGCEVCEDGPPVWCASCWVGQVVTYRRELREIGHDIGRWPDY